MLFRPVLEQLCAFLVSLRLALRNVRQSSDRLSGDSPAVCSAYESCFKG